MGPAADEGYVIPRWVSAAVPFSVGGWSLLRAGLYVFDCSWQGQTTKGEWKLVLVAHASSTHELTLCSNDKITFSSGWCNMKIERDKSF